jgi:hypothetical protein
LNTYKDKDYSSAEGEIIISEEMQKELSKGELCISVNELILNNDTITIITGKDVVDTLKQFKEIIITDNEDNKIKLVQIKL